MNKVMLSGGLGADPEARTTSSGTVITTLRLATSSRKKDGDQWVEVTDWHRVVTFGKLAENCAKYLVKGSKALVEGRLSYRTYEKDGEKRYITEVIADNVEFLSSPKGRGDEREPVTNDQEDIPFRQGGTRNSHPDPWAEGDDDPADDPAHDHD